MIYIEKGDTKIMKAMSLDGGSGSISRMDSAVFYLVKLQDGKWLGNTDTSVDCWDHAKLYPEDQKHCAELLAHTFIGAQLFYVYVNLPVPAVTAESVVQDSQSSDEITPLLGSLEKKILSWLYTQASMPTLKKLTSQFVNGIYSGYGVSSACDRLVTRGLLCYDETTLMYSLSEAGVLYCTYEHVRSKYGLVQLSLLSYMYSNGGSLDIGIYMHSPNAYPAQDVGFALNALISGGEVVQTGKATALHYELTKYGRQVMGWA